MPFAPARLCPHPGCAKLGKHRHKSAYEARRGGSTERGYDAIWQRLRKIVLAEEPLCRYCEAMGIVKAADSVDHMLPLSKGGLRLARENLCGCCLDCNSAKGDRTAGEFIIYMRSNRSTAR